MKQTPASIRATDSEKRVQRLRRSNNRLLITVSVLGLAALGSSLWYLVRVGPGPAAPVTARARPIPSAISEPSERETARRTEPTPTRQDPLRQRLRKMLGDGGLRRPQPNWVDALATLLRCTTLILEEAPLEPDSLASEALFEVPQGLPRPWRQSCRFLDGNQQNWSRCFWESQEEEMADSTARQFVPERLQMVDVSLWTDEERTSLAPGELLSFSLSLELLEKEKEAPYLSVYFRLRRSAPPSGEQGPAPHTSGHFISQGSILKITTKAGLEQLVLGSPETSRLRRLGRRAMAALEGRLDPVPAALKRR